MTDAGRVPPDPDMVFRSLAAPGMEEDDILLCKLETWDGTTCTCLFFLSLRRCVLCLFGNPAKYSFFNYLKS